MGSSSSFDQFGAKLTRLSTAVNTLPRESARAIGDLGNDEVKALAVRLFGGDRKFSGAKRSRKAKRQATSRYRAFGDRVEIYPSGDPFYIFYRGRRGGRKIYRLAGGKPGSGRGRTGKGAHLASGLGGRGRPAIGGPGGPRAYSIIGTLRARPDLIDPARRRIAQEAPKIVDRELQHVIGRVL